MLFLFVCVEGFSSCEMPLQHIAVASPSNKSMENSVTVNGQMMGGTGEIAGAEYDSNDNRIIDGIDGVTLKCVVDSTNDLTLSDVAVATHIEADAVIIGDTNSDTLSDDTGRQSDMGSDGLHVEVIRPGIDTPSNANSDISNCGHVTNTDRQFQNRNIGKPGKKEKPTPVKKKDSETQVCISI